MNGHPCFCKGRPDVLGDHVFKGLQLMDDFLAGIAPVDPKDGRKTCDNSWCELQSPCRVSELEQHQAQAETMNGEAP